MAIREKKMAFIVQIFVTTRPVVYVTLIVFR